MAEHLATNFTNRLPNIETMGPKALHTNINA